MPFKFYVDNNSDLPYSYTSENDIAVMPVFVNLDGVEYAVSNDLSAPGALDPKDFYRKMREGGKPTTSQLSANFFVAQFESELEKGNDILYLTFSSALSGIYEGSQVAREMLKERFPSGKVITVDSRCASLGYGLMAYLLREKIKTGATIEEVAGYAEEIKLKVHHVFTIDDLIYLKRGGRVSATSAFFGTVLQVKPVLHVDERGALIPIEKKQGRKRSLMGLVEHMEKKVPNLSHPIFLSHGDCEEEAQFVVRQIKEKFGVDVAIFNTISPVIGSHSGPGTVALFFVSDAER